MKYIDALSVQKETKRSTRIPFLLGVGTVFATCMQDATPHRATEDMYSATGESIVAFLDSEQDACSGPPEDLGLWIQDVPLVCQRRLL